MRMDRFVRRAAACGGLPLWVFSFTTLAEAASTSMSIAANDRGRYDDTGFHNPVSDIYRAGICLPPDCALSTTSRSFFTFDLSAVTQDPVAATLRIGLPVTGVSTPDADETYVLFEVTTAVATLNAGLGGVGVYTDLGDGPSYGTVTIVEADEGTIVDIPLNAAGLAAISAAAGGDFAIGGAVTSLGGGGDLGVRVWRLNGPGRAARPLLQRH